MVSKRVHLKNINRVILSETLPREVPYIFSNRYLYDKIKKNKEYQSGKVKGYYIPYDYKIKKDTTDYRKLGIMHPKMQIDFIRFYEKYKDLILYYCNLSPFSLRKPIAIRKSYKIKDFNDSKNIDEEREQNISYFRYEKYDIKARFFESFDFIKFEKKFKYLITTDISKCFYNIYTHTIAWAIKDKKYAKDNINKKIGFEKEFDKIMQASNYKETNGILVGAEISRIFAEIILQKIDINILNQLEKYELKNEVDYTIKRYMDDYFIYFNDINKKDLIINTIKEELEFYKLYINEKKTKEFLLKPFITSISIAKIEIKKLFSNSFFKIDEKSNLKVEDFITEFKSIIFNNEILYSSISGYVISIILKKINALIKKVEEYNIKNFLHKLFNMLDILFFVYTMDVRFENTNKITEILLNIKKCLEKTIFSNEKKDLILKKIRDESIYIIKNNFCAEENISSEILNFLITFTLIVDDFYNYLNVEDLKKIFKISDKINNLNYFQIITLIFICKTSKDDCIYSELEKEIYKIAKEKIKDSKSAEDIMLYCDLKSLNKNVKLGGQDDTLKNVKFTNFNFKMEDLKLKIKMSKRNVKENY